MGSHSKQKGAGYEREICKALSRWVSHGKREDLFWRSAMSGGRATVGRKRGVDLAGHAGDISATHPDGHKLLDHWYVECKRYSDLKIESALLDGVGTLMAHWRTTCEEATRVKKMPMLIARQDRRETLLIIPRPNMLTPSGTETFKWSTCLLQSNVMLASFYSFDKVMATEFVSKRFDAHVGFEGFLKPGELARILGYEEPKQKRVRVRV